VFGNHTLTALRHGDWKLVLPQQPPFVDLPSNKPMLYNLAEDMGESKNLAAEMPKKTGKLLELLRETEADMQKDSVSR
jgi:arylsulfatase A-like enzyme